MTSLQMSLPFLQFSPFGAAILAGTKFQAEFAGAALRYQIEGLSFWLDRIYKDVIFASALANPQAVRDASDLINDFSTQMITDYARETSRIFAVAAKTANETATIAHVEALRTIEDIAASSVAP
ncbi:hypothetical protein SAMN02927900_05988 [Rhizobium mongolense subsp. loessense]|uniref:Phasin protein n=1 Tax=Rhizobium mongolense subsp. loessense TaxID=158890 RepID=A0A1G4U3Z7_9HYPH|nr:hypothetical protein [Rhizobium mongolense]SCW87645.1 hypothetical protein SAMN02927900_05988 [Rhizobium mongolense subsp. loessense]